MITNNRTAVVSTNSRQLLNISHGYYSYLVSIALSWRPFEFVGWVNY